MKLISKTRSPALARIFHTLRETEIAGVVLTVDFCDSASEEIPEDDHFRYLIAEKVRRLNSISCMSAGVIAMFRRRTWNSHDQIWMGWERKRGKIVEFLRMTRGMRTSFIDELPTKLINCEYIMTIDLDTRVEPGTVMRLVAALEAYGDDGPAIATPTLDTLERPIEPRERWLVQPNSFRPDLHEPKAAQLVFGRESFNGKGVIAIERFLERTDQIQDNCVLSHDHLEALLAGACAVAKACVFEPFPSTRGAWERRQHRWYRGDFQILPWAVSGKSWYGSAARRIPWQSRITASFIASAPINYAIRYITFVAILSVSNLDAILFLSAVGLFCRDGFADGVMTFLRSRINGYRKVTLWRSAGFHLLNSFFRSIGEVVFFQRTAVLAGHAILLTGFRFLRGGRKDLLEWYPNRPDSAVVARRYLEALLLSGACLVFFSFTAASNIVFFVSFWILAASLITHLPPQRRRSISAHAQG